MIESIKKRGFWIASALVILLYLIARYNFSSFIVGVNLPHSIGLLLLSLLAFLYVWNLAEKTYPIEKVFLALWILLSAMYVCSSPLFNVPDEYNHFFRAFEISSGEMISQIQGTGITAAGSVLPTGVASVASEAIHVSWENFYQNIGLTLGEETAFVGFANTASYSPISYIPQVLGIFLMRIITDNVYAIAYAGRAANWLAITALLYAAIKYLPSGKAALALIALTPMNISESVSLAPDGMVVAVSAFMIAYVLNIRASKPILKWKNFAILYCLAVVISLYKIVYLPLCLIYFLIPEECCGGKRKKIIHAVLIALLAGISNLLWLNIARRFLIIEGTDSTAQVFYILTDPLNFLLVLVRTWFNNAVIWLYELLGHSLGWLDVSVGDSLVVIYGIMLISVFSPAGKVGTKDEAVQFNCSVLVLCVALLTSAALYIQWTTPYASTIAGIQGRYFLPLLLPLYFTLNPCSKRTGQEKLGMYRAGVISAVNICANVALLADAL